MPPIAYFGIESSGLSLVIDLLILFLVVLYFSLVYWTYADARRRIADPMLVGCATVAALFPFVGPIIYMILRPPEYLEDVHERELEVQAAEARLHDLDHSLCPHCDYRIERDFLRCPSCLRKLKERCVSCSRPLDRAWTICPYCETEVEQAKSARRSSGREAAGREGREGRASSREAGGRSSSPRERAATPAGARARTADLEGTSEPKPATSRASASAEEPLTEVTPTAKRAAPSRGSTRPTGRPRPTS